MLHLLSFGSFTAYCVTAVNEYIVYLVGYIGLQLLRIKKNSHIAVQLNGSTILQIQDAGYQQLNVIICYLSFSIA